MNPLGALACLALVSHPVATRKAIGSQACVTRTVEVDSTHANFAALAFSGRAVAQVFLAPDTLISAITVWRNAANYANASGMHLFLCGVDATLKPLPATAVLYDGPTLVPGVSDSVFAPLRYELDPPVSLPFRGHFAFAIKEEDPVCDLAFTLLGDSTGSYPEGNGWIVHPFVDCHALGSNVTTLGVEQPADLVFKVEFCEVATPALPATWGSVKARYR